jgi:hypothetical protein
VKHSPDVATGIKAALEQAARCVAAETSDNYGDLDAQLEALDGAARMTVQARLDIPSLLKKLKQQESLGARRLEDARAIDRGRRRVLRQIRSRP